MSHLQLVPNNNQVAPTLFSRGREIGSEMEQDLRNAVLSFYAKALPWAYDVKDLKPWETKEFSKLKDNDPEKSFQTFLRFSLSESGESLVSHQAAILKMMVDKEWTVEMIEGIGLKRLWRISNVIKSVNSDDQERLLLSAKNDEYRRFDALCKELKLGYHIEPLKDKLITGSESSIAMIDEFVDAKKANGDTRLQGEIIADAVGSVMFTEGDQESKELALIALLCDTMRFLNRKMQDLSNVAIQACVAKEMLGAYVEEMPDHLLRRYNELMEDDVIDAEFTKVEDDDD